MKFSSLLHVTVALLGPASILAQGTRGGRVQGRVLGGNDSPDNDVDDLVFEDFARMDLKNDFETDHDGVEHPNHRLLPFFTLADQPEKKLAKELQNKANDVQQKADEKQQKADELANTPLMEGKAKEMQKEADKIQEKADDLQQQADEAQEKALNRRNYLCRCSKWDGERGFLGFQQGGILCLSVEPQIHFRTIPQHRQKLSWRLLRRVRGSP